MPGSLGKGPADYYALGDYNARCSICGAKEKASKLVRNWQGLYRHPANSKNGCNEPRQPQDFVRGVQDIQTPPWVQSDENGDIDIQICTFNGQSALPGYAIPGCMIPGRTQLLESEFAPPIPPPPLTPPPLPPPVAQIGSPALLLHLNALNTTVPRALLLHMDGTNGATAFPDSSVNTISMAQNGTSSATVETATVEFGTGAMLSPQSPSTSTTINGISTPIIAGGPLDILSGTGDFTIEGFFNIPTGSASSSCAIFSYGDSVATAFANSSGIVLSTNGFALITNIPGWTGNASPPAVASNTWNHFAIVRSGGAGHVYLNGVDITNAARTWSGYAGPPSGSKLIIGGSGNASNCNIAAGVLIDEFSVTKGAALYTGAFTPPAAPFTAQAPLFLPNYIDSSLSHWTVTPIGLAVGGQSNFKFGNSSVSMPAAANTSVQINALTVPIVANSTLDILSGTANFTVEGWFFLATGTVNSVVLVDYGDILFSASNNHGFYLDCNQGSGVFKVFSSVAGWGSAGLGSGAVVALNTWHHFAVVRLSGVPNLYLDGVNQGGQTGTWLNYTGVPAGSIIQLGGSAVISNNNTANGIFMDEIRVTPKLALYTTNFTPPTPEGLNGLPNILGPATPPP